MSAHITRIPPCPVYETRRFERWLEDMAKEGWFLRHFSVSRYGSVNFSKSEPCTVRFRLQPAPKKASRFSRRDQQQEAVDLAAEFGWVLQDLYEGYFIYYTINPDTPELDTDPQVQAMALEAHRKRRLNRFFAELAIVALFLGLILWVGPISFALRSPVWYLPLILSGFLFALCLHAKELRHLKLSAKGSFTDDASRKAPILTHKATVLASVSIHFLLIFTIFFNGFFQWQTFRWQPVAKYPGELPFATIEDVTGGTLSTKRSGADNRVASRSTLLAKTYISLEQIGEIVCDETASTSVILDLDYYELRSEWLAERLFREILHTVSLSRGKYQEYAEMEIPELPVDQAAAYSQVYPSLLLQEGSKVLRVRIFLVEGNRVIKPSEWAPVFAESILD